MLAASDRTEIRACDGLSAPLGETTPRPVFQAAYEELCTRIWIELERLGQLESRRPQDLDMRTAILRLEFVVLLDFCRSPGWRSMLSTQQRESLSSMLTDVLSALYVDSEQLRDGIEAAQDRVLYELLPESAAVPSAAEVAHAGGEPRGSQASGASALLRGEAL